VSGGHFNPAVTFGFVVTRRITLPMAAGYWVAQFAGAVVASMLLTQVFANDVWQAVRLGVPALAPVLTPVGGVLLELVMTALLVTAVWGTAVDERHPPIGGFGIGLTVGMNILAFGPLTGGAMNTARAFGPALVTGVWNDHWVYWIGPFAGAAIASLIYDRWLLRRP
jgi:aquaporin Z